MAEFAINVVMPPVDLTSDQLKQIVMRALATTDAGQRFSFVYRDGDLPLLSLAASEMATNFFHIHVEVPKVFTGLPDDEAFLCRFALCELRIRRAIANALA